MSRDLITVSHETPLREAARLLLLAELARRMIDAHIHRLVVVDRLHRPVGLVSSTDILAGIARPRN